MFFTEFANAKRVPPPFLPTSSTDYNTNKSSSWRLFFLSKATNPATFVVFENSKARITLQLGLLCSTSSGCCREPMSRPKALTGGQSLSSLAQQSDRRGEETHTPLRVQAANESRMRMATAVPALAYRAGCKCKCALTLTQK